MFVAIGLHIHSFCTRESLRKHITPVRARLYQREINIPFYDRLAAETESTYDLHLPLRLAV